MYKFIFKDANNIIVYVSTSNYTSLGEAKYAGEAYYDSDRYPNVESIEGVSENNPAITNLL